MLVKKFTRYKKWIRYKSSFNYLSPCLVSGLYSLGRSLHFVNKSLLVNSKHKHKSPSFSKYHISLVTQSVFTEPEPGAGERGGGGGEGGGQPHPPPLQSRGVQVGGVWHPLRLIPRLPHPPQQEPRAGRPEHGADQGPDPDCGAAGGPGGQGAGQAAGHDGSPQDSPGPGGAARPLPGPLVPPRPLLPRHGEPRGACAQEKTSRPKFFYWRWVKREFSG